MKTYPNQSSVENKKNLWRFSFQRIILGLSLALCLSSCMETVVPEDSKERNLRVLTLRRQFRGSDLPPAALPGVDVTIAQPIANALLAEKKSDANGVADFQIATPINGTNIDITGRYASQVKRKSDFLICNDTTVSLVFDNLPTQNLSCPVNDVVSSIVFLDENGSPNLRQNMPLGVGRYEDCRSFVNNSNFDVTVELVQLPQIPFSNPTLLLNGEEIPGSRVVVQPGDLISMCFTVSTAEIGQFSSQAVFLLTCEGSAPARLNLNLSATVIERQCDCAELNVAQTYSIDEKIPVGSEIIVPISIFTNTLPCAATIQNVVFTDNSSRGEWTIVSPQFPFVLDEGATLTLNLKFAPKALPGSSAQIQFDIQPENGTPCNADIEIEGEACVNQCPIVETGLISRPFDNTLPIIDTLSNRNDNRVFISISDITPPISSRVSKQYTIRVPDESCNFTDINVEVLYSDSYSPLYYSISPSSFSAQPGSVSNITVEFRSPNYIDFDAILAARRAAARRINGILADSAFKTTLRISANGCTQLIEVNTIVTKFPDISPIINLRPYRQRTLQKPAEENEVYSFGEKTREILRTIGANGPFPPNSGDIWVDVTNWDLGAPPQAPQLILRQSRFSGIKLWRSNYPENDFDNVALTFLAFQNDPNYDNGYGTGPIVGLQPGQVYALRQGASSPIYALMYVRRVDDGTENTTSKQSSVEFRSIYPAYVP